MTSRERMIAAFEYANPDRIPVVYHPSEAGLHVHGEKLRELFLRYPPDNPISFDHIPHPPPEAVSADGSYYEEITDAWGGCWGHHIFGIQGQPVAYPFATWQEGVERYQFPPLPATTSEEFRTSHLIAPGILEEYLVIEGWSATFQQLYALRPMEELLLDLALENPDLIRFLERLVDYNCECINFLLAKGVDAVMLADDWASQAGPLVSPQTFKSVFKPHYRRMIDTIRKAGKRIFFHCCGKMDYIFDELIDLGIDGLWHQSALYDNDQFAEKCRENQVTVYIHPDRQHLIPCGTPTEIHATIKRFAERHRRLGGGGIFYVEIENDAPFDNAKALIEAIDQYR